MREVELGDQVWAGDEWRRVCVCVCARRRHGPEPAEVPSILHPGSRPHKTYFMRRMSSH